MGIRSSLNGRFNHTKTRQEAIPQLEPAPLPTLMSPELILLGSQVQQRTLLSYALLAQKYKMGSLEQKRYFFGSRNSGIAELERIADESPEDARKQAALYEALIDSEPELVIKRFEDSRWARNNECLVQYLCALYETSQLERASKFLSSTPSLNPTSNTTTATASSLAPSFLRDLGTKDRPLWVISNNQSGGSGGWRRLGTFVNVLIIGSILYTIVSMNEQRLGGMTAKVHKLFSKEHAEKTYTFADVQGCDEAKAELEDIVEFLKNPEKFNKLGAKMPKGVLLVGPPGTGKTLLAKAVAGEADVPFFYASGSSFDEVFVGVGSLRIRQMFDQAKENSPAIIFIDELDAIGSKRNPRDPQHSRMSLNQLLTELDGFAESTGVIVIAATNIPEALDKALLRPGRFDKHIYVPLPDMRGRSQILEMYLKDVRLAPDVDTQVLARATPGFSGADLFKLVNEAKISASVENGQLVNMHHLEASKDEMIMGAERKSQQIGIEDRTLTAYHEGGHAIMALHTKGIKFIHITYLFLLNVDAVPIHKATIIPRGRALGMVTQLPEKDEFSMTKSQLLARMDVAMGGRVAEELIFGPDKITTGASSDFQQATAIARAMVTQYGMSERLGPIVVPQEDYEQLSATIKDLIDSEVKQLLDASHHRAHRLLNDNRRDLERLAKALLEYETLNRDEIEQLLNRHRREPIDHLF